MVVVAWSLDIRRHQLQQLLLVVMLMSISDQGNWQAVGQIPPCPSLILCWHDVHWHSKDKTVFSRPIAEADGPFLKYIFHNVQVNLNMRWWVWNENLNSTRQSFVVTSACHQNKKCTLFIFLNGVWYLFLTFVNESIILIYIFGPTCLCNTSLLSFHVFLNIVIWTCVIGSDTLYKFTYRYLLIDFRLKCFSLMYFAARPR